jgi:hypothetical protein
MTAREERLFALLDYAMQWVPSSINHECIHIYDRNWKPERCLYCWHRALEDERHKALASSRKVRARSETR